MQCTRSHTRSHTRLVHGCTFLTFVPICTMPRATDCLPVVSASVVGQASKATKTTKAAKYEESALVVSNALDGDGDARLAELPANETSVFAIGKATCVNPTLPPTVTGYTPSIQL